jgi:HD-GYP domain-containing protein (c-di-GMP phosphodiesterase class II)
MDAAIQEEYINNLTELRNHNNRVGFLAFNLAKRLKLDDDLKNDILIAGKYHDIGKNLIPKDILFKPGRLTDSEFEIIKMHPKYSYYLMKDLEFSNNVCDMIKHHHENYDGTGYPDGLKGVNIPVGSRILKICDVFDALTSDRVYRDRLNIVDALQIMNKEIDTFDFDIFSVFKKSLKYIC